MAITTQSHQMNLSINYSCKPKQMYLVFARMLLFQGGCPDSRRTFFGCCVRLLQHLHLSVCVCCVCWWLPATMAGQQRRRRCRSALSRHFSRAVRAVSNTKHHRQHRHHFGGGGGGGGRRRRRSHWRRGVWLCATRTEEKEEVALVVITASRKRERVCVCVAFSGGGVSGGDSARNTPVVPSSSAYVWLMVVCVCVCGRCVAMRRCRRRGFGHI